MVQTPRSGGAFRAESVGGGPLGLVGLDLCDGDELMVEPGISVESRRERDARHQRAGDGLVAVVDVLVGGIQECERGSMPSGKPADLGDDSARVDAQHGLGYPKARRQVLELLAQHSGVVLVQLPCRAMQRNQRRTRGQRGGGWQQARE